MKLLIHLLAALLLLIPGGLAAQSERDSSFIESVVVRAVTLMQAGDVEGAVKHLEYLDKKYPGNDAVNYYLAVCRIASGKLDEAEQLMAKAIAADTSNLWYKDFLANIYLNEGKTDKSSEIYLDLLSKHPEKYTNAYTLTLLGNKELSEYRDSLAMDNFEKALLISPDYTPAILGKSEIYRMQGNFPAYFSSIQQIVQNPDVNPKAKTEYVHRLLQHIDYNFYHAWGAQLDSLVAGCAAVHPSDSASLMLAGNWFYGTNRKEKGRQYFDKTLQAFPDKVWPQFLNMQLMMEDGASAKQIIDKCEEIIAVGGEKNPEVMPALSIIGDTYYKLGQKTNAYKAYERALKADPGYLPVLNNYAYYLSLDGKKLKKAAAMSRITVEKEPDNATYLDTYGWILYLQKQYQKAKPYFKHAMLYGGRDSAVILEHYAKVLEALGETDLAKSFMILSENKKKTE
jgi:tetratricopeptide (TPR) repeat protein